MKTKAIVIFILILLLCLNTSADETIIIGGMNGLNPDSSVEKHSVLLALSGGGARGLTVVGILKAFEEKDIRIDALAGTSMGGIIGGLYSSGYTPSQLDSIVTEIDFQLLFSNTPPRSSMFLTQRQNRQHHLINIRFDGYKPVIPRGLTAGQELTYLLTALTAKANYQCGSDFTKLPIPFSTISTDIVSGSKVILNSGSLAESMRSTMSYPLAFTGLERENQILMDGGMVTPIPVDLVRSLSDSINYVVAINTTSELSPKKDLNNPVEIAAQVTSIMTSDKLKDALKRADYVISPPIQGYRSNDFINKKKLIDIGYQQGLIAADSIIAQLKIKKPDRELFIAGINDFGLPVDVLNDINELLNKSIPHSELIKTFKAIVLKYNLFKLKLDIIKTQSESNHPNSVDLKISTVNSLPYLETKFIFDGNSVFNDSLLANQFISDNNNICPEVIRDGIKNIISLYKNLGYDLVFIKNIDIDHLTKTISISIDEAVIRKIDIEQNQRTKDWFVRTHFPLKKDQPYSTEQAARGIRNIYATNLFDRVTLNLVPSSQGLILKIIVVEKAYTQTRFGWHWDDEYESEEFAELLDDNVAGIGLEYRVHAGYSPRRQQYYFNFQTDRIFSTYITANFKLYHNRLERSMYGLLEEEIGERYEITSGGEFVIGQQIARLGTVTAGLSVEQVKYTDSLDVVLEEPIRYGLRILKFESHVENFDRIPFTNTGNKNLMRFQFAGKYIGGEVEYTKFFTSHEVYIPLGTVINYHPKIALGISRSGLPPTEQFYLGGFHSFAGFRTFQISGDKMFIFSNEIRFKLPYKFYTTFKYDLGEVYNSTDQIKLRNLRNSVGITLAIDSPIGPIEAAYGIANSDTKHFYLNVGLEF